jgi:superfamily II DNA or RNA helicase
MEEGNRVIAELPDLWMPQANAIRQVTDALADGQRRICLALPTGGGKSRIACELIRDWLHVGYKVSLYTNRKMLIEQLVRTLNTFGLSHGTRSAAHMETELPTNDALQVSSIQTESSRVLKKKTWQLHEADRIIVDEAHLNASATAKTLLDLHLAQGASYVGLTATPLDIGHLYDHLIVAGTNSELRACGALVPALHYGPDEPDCKKIKKSKIEEHRDYSEAEVRKVMNVQTLFGRIVEWFNKLNPEHKPSICFAPGVPESIWLAEEFSKNGIEAAHIDGQTCFYKGERYDSDREVRDEILRASRAGEVKIICNRFVLREGIDAPWLAHGILATIFGSLQSYLQSVGRLLRAHHSLDSVTIQDHGGNWWRHGSANADRHWELGDTDDVAQGIRQERLRQKIDREPMVCPQCKKIMMTSRCSCGFMITKKSRPVIQEDGTLKEHGGDIFRPRFTRHNHDTQALWEKMYFRSRNAKKPRTFRAAMGLFVYENGYWPPADLPFMPKNPRDHFRLVKDVPRSDLT